eukprot:UN08256
MRYLGERFKSCTCRWQKISRSKNNEKKKRQYVGTRWKPLGNKWEARLGTEGKMVGLGYFKDEKENR